MGVEFSFGTIGGILLIIGAFFVYKGEIYRSVFVYFVADIAWVILAYRSGDGIGTILILLGMLLGLGAFLKMNYGQMRKDLNW